MHIGRSKRTVGESPGTIEYRGRPREEAATVTMMDYDTAVLNEHGITDASECATLRDSATVTWINVSGVHDAELVARLGEQFKLHPLVCEDIVHVGQRPKLEDHEDYLYLVVKMLHRGENDARVSVEQVSIVLGAHFVLTFQEDPDDVFDPVRRRIRDGKVRIRRGGPDYLAYALLDAIVDYYFVGLERIGDEIETLEEEMSENPSTAVLQKIHQLKRELIVMRKPIWPLREVVGSMTRESTKLISDSTHVFLRDVYDHVLQVIDAIDSYRERISGLQDLYMSYVSNRMNEVMKVLTIIATIFVPMTFVAGIYGMNFEFMPELAWRPGYAVFWAVVLTIAVTMLTFFKRRGWL